MTWTCRWAASRMLGLDFCRSQDGWSSRHTCGKGLGLDGCPRPFCPEAQDTQPKSQAPTKGLPLTAQPLCPAEGLAQAVPVTQASFGDPPFRIFKIVPCLHSCQSRRAVQPFGL